MGVVARAKHRVKAFLLATRSVMAVAQAAWYDGRRYVWFSSTVGPFATRDNLAAKVTERYHGIEKGLSLPSPRPGFGARNVTALIRLTERYEREHGFDAIAAASWGALSAYVDFNRAAGLPDDQIPGASVVMRHADRASSMAIESGTKLMSRQSVVAAVSGVDLDFFTTRHSTRIFAAEPVPHEDIVFAVTAASSAPAVCNRQFAKIHVWRDRSRIDELLSIQGGARGFSDQITGLAMITVSLRSYWAAAERYQGWIDGGLFAMNFMLGMHAQGHGAVPLNWSKTPELDRRMRAASGIDPAETIIMLVGFGRLAEQYRVAASPRFGPLLTMHE